MKREWYDGAAPRVLSAMALTCFADGHGDEPPGGTPPAGVPPADPPSDPPAGDDPPADPPSADDPPADPPKRYEPEGIDPSELGETDQETIDKLAKRMKGLREELSKKPAAPKTAEEYPAIEFDEGFKDKFGQPDDDEAVKLVRDIAHKHGLPPDLYSGFVKDVMQGAAEAGLLDPYVDLAKEIEAVGGPEKFDQQVTDYSARLDGLAEQGAFSKDAAEQMKYLLTAASGHEALTWMFGKMAEKGVQTGPGTGAGGEFATMAAVEKAMEDPRYDTKSPKYDEEYVKKVRAAFARLNPAK